MPLYSATNIPREGNSPVSPVPIKSSTTKPFYPPVCLQYHWDPTAMLRHIVPQGASIALPLDPRPWTKVCMTYVNSGDASVKVPAVSSNLVFPSGGQFYPPTRYSNNINNESLLRRLDRPIDTCDDKQYYPNPNGDMYNSRVLVPRESNCTNTDMVSELSMPRALLRNGVYDCVAEAQGFDWSRSPNMFNNATKQQRYNQSFPTKKLVPAKSIPELK